MLRRSFLSTLAIFYLLGDTVARKLPSFIHTCSSKSPNLNQCMIKSLDDILPRLPNGIPEMHIPVLEPLHVPHAELDTGATFKATFNDIRIYGLTNFILKNLDMDLNKNSVSLHLLFPFVRTEATYSMKGRLLIMSLNGFGRCDGNYTNLETQAVINGQRFGRRGKEYINFSKIKLDIQFGNPNSMVFDNIFRGNKELTDQTNRVISENIEGIMMEIKPVFDDTVAQLVLGLLRGVFNRYSLDDLFPNN